MGPTAAPNFDELAAAALAECPGLSGPAAEFARHLEALASGDPALDVGNLRLGDLYLAWCCARGCPRAVERFWTDHVPTIRDTAISVVRDAARADDVVQDVLRHVLVGRGESGAAIASFEGRSRLGRWLRAATVRAGLTARARLDGTVAADDTTALTPAVADDPELALLKARSGDTVERALRRALSALAPDERLVLQQHVVDGLSIDQLATIYRIHRATAARRIAKAQEALRVATRRHLREATQLLGEELESLIRFAQSRVHLSMRSLAAGREPGAE